MSEGPNISFLPSDLVKVFETCDKLQHLQDENRLIKVEFRISARTNDKDYRCRKLDDYDIHILTTHSTIDGSVKSKIEDYLLFNSNITCTNGKYPDISISGVLQEYYTDTTDDRNRELATLDGYVWIWNSNTNCDTDCDTDSDTD